MIPFLKRLFRDTWAVFAVFLLIYVALFLRHVLMDIPSQMYTLRQVCNGEVAMPPTALFYILAWIGALGQCQSKIFLGMGAALACAGPLTARWMITRQMLLDFERKYLTEESKTKISGHLAFALALVCSLPTQDWWLKGWYLIGQASPNYWMNGTLLASWPFALVLFWQSYKQLLKPDASWWRWMLLWLVLLLVSKPSYAMVFAVVYPLFLMGRHGLSRAVRIQLIPMGILAILFVLEFYLVFLQSDSVYVKQFNHGNQSGVSICFFCVWQIFASNQGVSLLASILFPLTAALVYWQEFSKKLLFWYAWAGFLVAIAISATLVQTGEEFTCWNFRWQTYLSAYLLFLVTSMLVWERIQSEPFRLNFRARLVVAAFALHLISGIVYLMKMWWTQSHY